MSSPAGNRSLHQLTQIPKFIILIAIAILTLLFVSSGIVSAQPRVVTGLQATAVQETDYDWPSMEPSEFYTEHLDAYFKLYSKQEAGQLRVYLPDIPDVLTPRTYFGYKYIFEFELEEFKYNTVSRPEDCSLELFSRQYGRILNYQQNTQNYLPLRSSDYDRYHCFRVTLSTDRPLRPDPRPKRVFVAKTPVAGENINNDLGGFPAFSQAIMQETHYDYVGGLFVDSAQFKPEYYARLDDNFNLHYAHRADGSFDLRITLPGHFAINNGRDINGFSLEYLEYATVTDRSNCYRGLFDNDGAVRDGQPALSMSLAPAPSDSGKHYCVKVKITGERTFGFDFDAYRVFYIPQNITDAGADDIWLHL